eukprot:CAMPEP_0118980894 /NCGR_PEP_ID=MMETSP1173-20130426/29351_1 /TAXON_ID=1034831 /ORGANISM="Rhizochromulina marina cf, Strain CCMP1243" /LENGTH=51 /DNA_ID=CAMNT_0006931275 /DNA_START=212 /DNA_END=364 /DNA_ORIENTATION=-
MPWRWDPDRASTSLLVDLRATIAAAGGFVPHNMTPSTKLTRPLAVKAPRAG